MMEKETMTTTVSLPEGEAVRADKYISGLGIMKRSQFESRKLKVLMDDEEMKLSRKVRNGDVLVLEWEEAEEPDYSPEKIDLDIIFENKDVIVINKPQGLVVHPGAGNTSGTLVQGLLYYNRHLSENFADETLRPGIVHRLDKDTSGLIITAKSPEALELLSEQFRNRSTEKYYLALVKGRMPARRGKIEGLITRDEKNRKKFRVHPTKGKHALTRYEVLQAWDRYSLLKLKIETGRTHQIRVHLQSLGCPILGDSVYSRRDNFIGDVSMMLHSWKLGITLPGETEPRVFEAPVPPRFDELQKRIEQADSR